MKRINDNYTNQGFFQLLRPEQLFTLIILSIMFFYAEGAHAQRVGIGITTPYAGLHLKGSGFPESFMYLQANIGQDAGFRLFEGETIKWNIIHQASAGGLSIVPNSMQPALFINQANGNIGIGTTTPLSLLHAHSNTTYGYGITPVMSISDNFKIWYVGLGSSDDRFSIASQDYSERLAILKANGNVGIGTTSPGAKLEIAGQVKITGGNPGIGKILTSDATGLASWQAPQPVTWLKNGSDIYYNTGRVAIGMNFPRYDLSIYQDNDPHIGFYNSTSGTSGTDGFTISTGASGSPVWIWNWENSNMHFGTNNANRMVINADGHISMMRTLDLNTDGTFGALYVKGKQALWSDDTYFSWGYDALWNYFNDRVSIGRAVDPGSSYMLYVQGTAYATGSWNSSDIRFKKNILPISGALNKVLQVSGNSFEFRNDEFQDYHFSRGKQYGFIAQDLEKVFPEMVNTESDGYKSVNYNGMIPVLLEAIKEQQKIIEMLKKENENQNARLEKLENRNK